MPTLTWLTREEDLKRAGRAPYRLLEPVPELSYGDPDTGNMLIQGDNLDALKALLPYFAGKVKCIYIDPPYNTRSAFEHYDDNLEHSQWLAMMYPRLELLRVLLSREGSIRVSIDDNEGHYLKAMMDEVFGRSAFVASVIWQKRTSRENRAAFGSSHDYVLLYAPSGPLAWKDLRNRLPANGSGFSNPDNDPRGAWRSIPFSAQGFRPNQMYPIKTPAGGIVHPPKGRCWAATEPVFQKFLAEKRVYFPNSGTGRPRIKQFRGEEEGLVPMTLWLAADSGDNEEAKKEALALFPDTEAFATPKPERLLQRILQIATNPGDLVLDSFLGSGTTSAVAQKMGRLHIGIEEGEHALSYCVPRLQKVIGGEQGGISIDAGWTGGGGFRFYRLGAPIFDANGHIRRDISFALLAAHVWFSEAGFPLARRTRSAVLGPVYKVAMRRHLRIAARCSASRKERASLS
jgi:adenine-specific DNA-methyltransferase